MPINLDKPQLWKADIAKSVDFFNSWFLKFAPKTYRETRIKVTTEVERMLQRTKNLSSVTIKELTDHPEILPALRMSTAPPLARDRLTGLARVTKSLVGTMEKDHCIPSKMDPILVEAQLKRISNLIMDLADVDIFPWLIDKRKPSKKEVFRAATIVADHLCGSRTDPIVRNAQEKRQLAEIKAWLKKRGYADQSGKVSFNTLKPGMFAVRLSIQGLKEDKEIVAIPVDIVVMPLAAAPPDIPVMIEAKSAGDFTNVNKRRKEEAVKVLQLRRKHGALVRYFLFLCGYFDSGYLGYEAAEGIDWVWEHRIDDFSQLGL